MNDADSFTTGYAYMHAYPSPVLGQLNLNISGVSEPFSGVVKIFNIFGEVVLSLDIEGSYSEFDLSDLLDDAYLLVIENNLKRNQSTIIIKQIK